jgi:DNA-binding MarR family transcriptional regulator
LEDCAAEIRRGVTRLARRLRAERPTEAISASRIGVLSYLYRFGPSTPGDFARYEHQRPQSLTRLFAGLEVEGLVSRTRGESDLRRSVLTITQAGIAVLERDMAQRDVWLAAALAELTGAEVQVLRVAAALMDRMADADPPILSDAPRP